MTPKKRRRELRASAGCRMAPEEKQETLVITIESVLGGDDDRTQ